MKKLVAWMLFGALAATPAYARERRDRDSNREKTSAASVAEARKKVETLKADLNGSSWEITLTPTDGKGKELKDELVFQNNQIVLKGYADKGFRPTNYTITPPAVEGGTAVWETMQTSDKEGLVFIRGEWKEKDQIMRGLISHQKEKEPSEDYNFVSQAKVTIEPVSKDKQAPEAAGEASPKPLKDESDVLVSKEARSR